MTTMSARQLWPPHRKVFGLGATLMTITCLVTIVGVFGLYRIQQQLHLHVGRDLERQSLLQDIAHSLLNAQLALETATSTNEPALRRVSLAQYRESLDQVRRYGESFADDHLESPKDRSKWKAYQTDFQIWQDAIPDSSTTSGTPASIERTELPRVPEYDSSNVQDAYRVMLANIADLHDMTVQKVRNEGFSRIGWMVSLIQTSMIIAMVIGLSASTLFTRKIARAIEQQEREVVANSQELQVQSERQEFDARLGNALAMSENEDQACELAREVMESLGGFTFDLLLADSSQAHLRRAAGVPAGEAPLCSVAKPYDCPAVRQGSSIVFESSEHFDACPKLKGRADGPCSAMCAPLTIMGRQVGVLHAVTPNHEPPGMLTRQALNSIASKFSDRLGLLRAFRQTRAQAATDPLTGLLNRRSLESRLKKLSLAMKPYSIVYCDIDHFKRLNDTHGHETGDRALRVFSRVLKETVRDDDYVARWGGEEFVIVLPGMKKTEAQDVINRVRGNLEDRLAGGSLPAFTASFGIGDTDDHSALDELLDLADNALLAAKNAGRNRITLVGYEALPSAA